MTTDSQNLNSKFLLETLNDVERKLAEANKEIQKLTQQNAKLKTTNQELKISHALETAFYEVGGKRSTNESGTSAFDLLRSVANDYVKFDEKEKLIFVDPRDGLELRTAEGKNYTPRDLMVKLKNSPVTGAMFENQAANSYLPNGLTPGNVTRETLRQIKDPAARLALAREHGIE